MGKSDELVKYITEKVVTYIDQPKEERQLRRSGSKKPKEPWTVQWFGLLPMAISMMWGRRRGTNTGNDKLDG